MKHAGIPFEVASLGSSRAREESPLGDLTARQAEVLRLAHSMGYYDVPKKVGIEDIAHMLGKDKGTVGEHLRRAEKHVFDQLLT
jgi:predicted DNA binding protein